ncbi:MAG: GLUG motif-containing protein, partial [Salinivirgaceae bacterium]
MKKANLQLKGLCVILSLLLSTSIFAQVATPPSQGDGTQETPYEIGSLENLYWLSQNDAEWDRHYIQTSNIDASVSESWNAGEGLTRIGNNVIKFSGTYNGQNYEIANVFINLPDSSAVGLFGFIEGIDARIDSLRIVNATITGLNFVGGLAGRTVLGTITACHSNGTITAIDRTAGGLIGNAKASTISQCYTYGQATTNEGNYCGGLIGYLNETTVNDSYSQTNVNCGNSHAGGFVGRCYQSTVQSSYSTGTVTGGGFNYSGGFSGSSSSAEFTSCFYDKETCGKPKGPGQGLTTEEMSFIPIYISNDWNFAVNNSATDAIWNINKNENNGYPLLAWQGYDFDPLNIQSHPSVTINGKSATVSGIFAASATEYGICWATSSEPLVDDFSISTNELASPLDTIQWELTDLEENTEYYIRMYVRVEGDIIYGDPKSFRTYIDEQTPTGSGTLSDPYLISTLNNLVWISNNSSVWNAYFSQTNDIDAIVTTNHHDAYTPIGNSDANFTGNYNGNGYKITNLHINQSYEQNVGLFGFVSGENALITNIQITNAHIIGHRETGILVGRLENGSILKSSVDGQSIGTYSNIGGLVGYIENGTIEQCYSKGKVYSSHGESTGGLIGYASYANISNCYSHANVIAVDKAAGFIGVNSNSTVSKCYSVGRAQAEYSSPFQNIVNNPTTTSCIYNSDSTNVVNPSYAILTTEELKWVGSFLNEGWDFSHEEANGTEEIWTINKDTNKGYPTFQWEEEYLPQMINGKPELSEITDNSATATIEMWGRIDEYGICWSTSETPTIEDQSLNATDLPLEIASVTWNLTSLAENTKYYIRAYAKLNNTIAYSTASSFTTVALPTAPSGSGTHQGVRDPEDLETRPST